MSLFSRKQKPQQNKLDKNFQEKKKKKKHVVFYADTHSFVGIFTYIPLHLQIFTFTFCIPAQLCQVPRFYEMKWKA